LTSPTFIHTRKNALSKDVCESLIDIFEKRTELHNEGVFGSGGETVKDDSIKSSTDVTFNPSYLDDEDFGPIFNENLIPTLQNGLNEYGNRFYLGMDNVCEMEISAFFNMQRYKPGGGYKIFHCERAGNQFFPRTLAWMIYLNDVETGGETEFFYQQLFERAEIGKLVIWPSDFTHMHRGIVAPYETKYILTGWYQYTEKVYAKEFDYENGEGVGDKYELSLNGAHTFSVENDSYHVLIKEGKND
jgi:hypothetical protein